ncbi:MAG TPA: flagellar biosynthetic protein FliO [Planctomycetota bacterium]|nr:flagellar biosynthetic protein FliO [Planctomycetota bacterium]
MPGEIALRTAGWLLAAALCLLPAAAASSAEARPAAQAAATAAPAAEVAPSAPRTQSPTMNLYDDGEVAAAGSGSRPGAEVPAAPVTAAKASALSMVARVGFWLGLVVALICGAVALARKVMPRTAAWGQSQTAEVVGRTYLEAKRCVYLVKVGSRVLVVGSAENGLSPLGEITDKSEVDYLACLARGRMTAGAGRRSDFSSRLGSRLARLTGLARESDEQVVDDETLASADATAEAGDEVAGEAVAAGATAASGGMDSLKEQLARLRRIS